MRRSITLAVAIVIAGSTLSAQTRRGRAEDEAAIRQLPQKYESAWNDRNTQQIAELYAVDALEVEPTGETLQGRSAIEANLRENFKRMGSGTLSLQTDTVRFLGPDTAVFTGTSTMRGSQPAGGVDQGHYMVIAKRIKGQWKASEVHLAAIPAATEPAAVGTAGGSGAAAEAAVNEVEDRWAKATVQGDWKVLDRIYADTYTFVDPTGQLMTREQDIDDLKSGRLKFESHEQTGVQTRVFGDTAVVTGISTIKGTYGGEDISGRYRWTDTFVRQQGEWRVVASQATPIREPSPQK